MRDKPNYCYEVNCPLANKGKGFALGCGDPNSKIAIMFERPANDEISYSFGGPRPPSIPLERWNKILEWQKGEYERRKKAFPELDTPDQRKFLVNGAPVRGMSGAEIRQWVLPYVGGGELESYFLENVLHCGAPDNQYPSGDIKEVAEACCTHWNQLIPISIRNRIQDHAKGAISVQDMRVVQEEIPSSTLFSKQETNTLAQQMEKETILQQELQRGFKSGAEKLSVERGSTSQWGLSLDLRKNEPSNSSGKDSLWSIHSGAPLSDGEEVETQIAARGNSSSQERDKNRQSTKQFGVNDTKSSQRPSMLPILPKEISDSVGCSIWSLHPAGILRETGGGIVALPLQQDTFTKAISFSRSGVKTLILAGGKAAKFWEGFGEAVTKWCGHYIKETEATWLRRMNRWRAAMELLKTNPTGLGQKGKRVKKLKSPSDPTKPRRSRKKPEAVKIAGMEALGL